MFKEAITDLSIAINLNKDLLDVRLVNITVGIPKQREVCISDWRYWTGIHGFLKDYRY